MADKSQQIKTDLIFKADDAINNIKELSDLLSKINGFTFSRTASGMDKFTKAVKDAVDSSQKATQTQTDGEQKIQNLLKQRIELIKKLEDAYSKNPKTANTPDWDKQTRALVDLNEKIADMYVNMGKARDAVKFLQEALTGSLYNSKAFDTNLQQLGKLKAELAAVGRKVKDTANSFDFEKQQEEGLKAQQKAYNQRIKDLQTFAKTAQAEYDSLFKSINSHAGVKGLLYTDEQQDADIRRLQKLRNSMRSIMGEEAWKNAGATAYSKLEEAYVKTLSNSKLTSGTAIKGIKDIQEQSLKSAVEVGSLGKELSKLKTLLESLKAVGNDGLYKELLGLYTQYAKVRKQVQDDIKSSVNPPKTKPNQEAVQAAKAEAKAQDDAEKAARQHLQTLDKLNRKWEEIRRSIENHSGADGLTYSHAGLNNMIARIESLKKQYEQIGEKGPADLLNPSLLSGVNTTIGRFNSQLSEARVKAQELYMTFQKTKSEADRLRFLNARDDFVRLNDEAERFDRTISKTRRDVLSPANISKRAVESFNWMAGSAIENSIVNFPFDVIEKVKSYELEMAGIEQVLPKISNEIGDVNRYQAVMNEEFSNFAEIAGRYGQSVEDTLTAAKSLGRMYGQGDGDADIGANNTEILTAQAAKMATTDNFEMLAATQGLESALSQFNMQTEDSNMLMARSSHILDVWTKLAHTSGASAQDLTEGVKQAGASAHEAGISFEFLNALIATGVRTTAKSGNEIGTMLKSLFASMQQDKAIKAMQAFGIEVYRVGATGKKELRPMQDLIFDISKALETTNKDTKGVSDFLLAISGGKYQVSKVAALLGNYKELQRTLSSAQNSSGFTDQQLEMQMNTVSRKLQTLKSNISQLFQQSGSNGLVNDLKWILNILNNITQGMKNSEMSAYQWGKRVVALVAAYKLIPSILNQIAKAYGRASASLDMTRGKKASEVLSPNIQAGSSLSSTAENAKRNYKKDHALKEEKGDVESNTSSISANTNARNINTTSVNSQNTAISAQNGIITKNTAVQGTNASAQKVSSAVSIGQYNNVKKMGQAHKIASVEVKKGTSALKNYSSAASTTSSSVTKVSTSVRGFSAATRLFTPIAEAGTVAARGFSAAIAAFGGPIGAVITGLTLLSIGWTMYDEAQGEAIEEQQKAQQELENTIVTAQEEAEQIQVNTKHAEELAERYNTLKDELDNLTKSTDNNAESSKKAGEIRKEMGSISSQIQQLMHADAIEFDEDGKINKKTIETLANANKQMCLQKIQGAQDQIQADYDTKNALIETTRQKIEAFDAEGKAIKHTMELYRAMLVVATGLHKSLAIADNSIGNMLAKSANEHGLLTMIFDEKTVRGWADDFYASAKAHMQYADNDWANAGDWGKDPDISYDDAKNQIATLQGQADKLENTYNTLGKAAYRLKYGVNPDGSPITNDELIDPTRENVNADKEGTQPKPPKTRHSKGRSKKNPDYQKREWTYGDKASRVMSTIVADLDKEGWNKAGVTIPALMTLANLINGRNGTYWDDISDLFGTGDSNMWDSGYNLKNKLIDQFQQGKTLEEAFKALAPSVPQSEWDNAFGGASNYIQYLTDHWNYDKFKRDFTGDDPYSKGYGAGSGGGYDYSVFTNPFLAEQAVIVSQKVKAKTGENVNPNQIYGTFMAETPNATADNYMQYLDGSLGFALGGLEMDVANLEKWQDAMAATFTNGGYDNTPTTMDWVNALARNNFKSDANTDQTYIASNDEYSNEKGWFDAGGMTDMASDVVDNAVASLGTIANESNNCVKSALAVLRQIPQMANDALANSGIVNGDDLVNMAGNYGWTAIPYDASKATPGALVTWYGDEGTNSHTGIISGVENGVVMDYDTRSSQGHQLIKSSVESKREWGSNWYPEYLILPPTQLVSSKQKNFRPRNRWAVGKDSVQAWTRNPIEEYIYNQEKVQKDYEKQKKLLELDKKQNGLTAVNAIRSYANDTSSLNATQGMADLWKSIKESRKKDLTDYINKYAGLANAVKANGLTTEEFLEKLPDSEIEELFKDARDTTKEKDVKAFLTARKKFGEFQGSLNEQKANINSEWYGFKSPADSIDYQLKQLEQSRKEYSYGTTQSETWQIDHDYYVNRVGLLEDKLDVFSKELRKIRQAEQARLEELSNQIDELENGTIDDDGNLSGGIAQLESKSDRTEEENKQLDEQKKKVEELRKQYQNLAKNHSDAYREIESKTQETNNQLEETKNKVNEVELAFREKLENGVASMFENIFLEGKDFRSSWKSLWQDIGRLAWEQLVKINLLSNVQKWSGAIGDIFGGRRTPRAAVTPELLGAMMSAPIRADSITGGIAAGIGNRAGSRQIAALTGRALDGTYFPMGRKAPVSSESVLDTMAGTGAQQVVNGNLKDLGAQLQKSNMVWQNMAAPIEQLGATTPLLQSATVASRASVIQQIASTGVNTAAINANTAAQSTGTISGGILGHANGGSLAKFASGGNTGLISGAGTGTSDSILTYLAHQGRFIATSNGEYIIKKSSVDRLGVNFLDMINQNPEAAAGLKRYADGGSLGESMVPVMSPKTVDSYNSLKKNQAVIKMNSNKKLEELMAQQNDMIGRMGSKDNSGNLVVLNTQADSSSVMKALAKNPRMVQKILGGQKKHGFGR